MIVEMSMSEIAFHLVLDVWLRIVLPQVFCSFFPQQLLLVLVPFAGIRFLYDPFLPLCQDIVGLLVEEGLEAA